MDKVRLGRALGYGTRHAARTLAAVAEAATAPDPRSSGTPSQSPLPRPAAVPQPRVESPRRMPSPAQVRGAGGAMWRPLAAYSGALWLRVTGLFFAVIALAMGNGAWRLRGQLHSSSPRSVPMQHFCFFLGFGLLFGYFAVSSFVRANRRERRP